ncbi:MAG: ATPase [Candidatus Moranbacteria bacterium]|nr:ATPase [Candidatus Moranbacteria bacterium]
MLNTSKRDSRLTIDYICNAPEGQYLERKGIGVKPTKLADEIIGMLNAGGGVLILGIDDSGQIQDLHSIDTEMLNRYRMIIHDFIKPPANVELEELTLESGELVFLYHVDQDSERVFTRNDTESVFLRMADSNKGPLSRDLVRKLEYDKTIRKYEDEICDDFDPADLRRTVLKYYRQKMSFAGTDEEILLKRNLAIRNKEGGLAYRNSAILLFAEDPDKYIPNAIVRYVRYNGTTAKTGAEYNVVKDERFTGCIPRLIEILKRFIYASLRDYYFLNIELGRFVKISEYPEDAWLEGIVNALCHRSYNIQGNAIYIKHFDDRLEISNSGPLPAQVTIENIRTERYARNPRIARVLSELGYVRELNEGVPRIYESMERSMLSSPEYTDENDIVTLSLRNKISEHEKVISDQVMGEIERQWPNLNETQSGVIMHIIENYQATIGELSAKLKKSKQAIRIYLNDFCEAEILERVSEKKRDVNALYRFKKS